MVNTNNLNISDGQKFVFGNLFLLANKLQIIGDHYLGKDDMTTKQWFLSVIIMQFGNDHPTLTEVSNLMGSSRQNVKQLALKLAEKGFISIEKDQKDTRAVRLKLTEKSRTFWEKRQTQDDQFITELFQDLNINEITTISGGIKKLLLKIAEIENRYSQKGEFSNE